MKKLQDKLMNLDSDLLNSRPLGHKIIENSKVVDSVNRKLSNTVLSIVDFDAKDKVIVDDSDKGAAIDIGEVSDPHGRKPSENIEEQSLYVKLKKNTEPSMCRTSR